MSKGGILNQKPEVPKNPETIASNVSYDNSSTSNIITGQNVQLAIDQLFTSVSNGKTQIASAITGKGVSTSPTDSFSEMAHKISNINVQKYELVSVYVTVKVEQGTGIRIPFRYIGENGWTEEIIGPSNYNDTTESKWVKIANNTALFAKNSFSETQVIITVSSIAPPNKIETITPSRLWLIFNPNYARP